MTVPRHRHRDHRYRPGCRRCGRDRLRGRAEGRHHHTPPGAARLPADPGASRGLGRAPPAPPGSDRQAAAAGRCCRSSRARKPTSLTMPSWSRPSSASTSVRPGGCAPANAPSGSGRTSRALQPGLALPSGVRQPVRDRPAHPGYAPGALRRDRDGRHLRRAHQARRGPTWCGGPPSRHCTRGCPWASTAGSGSMPVPEGGEAGSEGARRRPPSPLKAGARQPSIGPRGQPAERATAG
jgi:hypothetical protein